MYKYDAKSLKAEEFINDEEIRETLAYADANKGQCGADRRDHRKSAESARA